MENFIHFVRSLTFILVGGSWVCAAGVDLRRNSLAGAWSLVALEQRSKNGEMKRITDAEGSFLFLPDGHVAVQVMYAKADSDQDEYARGGYEATFGTYAFDDSKHTFTIHVEGALARTLIGKDLRRSYEISGDRMTVRSARPDEKWSVIWRRREGAEGR